MAGTHIFKAAPLARAIEAIVEAGGSEPREVVAKLNEAAVKALRSPEVRDRLTAIGFDIVAGSPEEFGAFMKAEVERWTRVVERGGIKPE